VSANFRPKDDIIVFRTSFLSRLFRRNASNTKTSVEETVQMTDEEEEIAVEDVNQSDVELDHRLDDLSDDTR